MSICAADVGSTFIKVAVYDADLRVCASTRVPLPARGGPGRAEAHPDQLWSAFAAAVREAAYAAGTPVTVLALSAQMAGLVLLDAAARPLGPVILGIDRRGLPRPPDPRTGCPPDAIYPAAKLAWLAEREPARLAGVGRVGGVKEYLLHRLTGAWVTDPSCASTTGWFDVSTGGWLSAPGRDREGGRPGAGEVPGTDWLPRVAGAADVAGPLCADAAAVCGLPAGIPVAVGLGDGPAANLAAGAVGGQRLCVSLGTTIVVRLLVRGSAVPESGLPCFVQRVAGEWCCVGVRFSGDPAAGYTPVGVPDLRLRPAELPVVLRPLLDTYGVTELRPAGGGRDPQALRELADIWRLPVRDTSAGDGTRGAALLARCTEGGTALEHALPELADAVAVCATIGPRGHHTARRGGD